jgi:hypothetical protein
MNPIKIFSGEATVIYHMEVTSIMAIMADEAYSRYVLEIQESEGESEGVERPTLNCSGESPTIHEAGTL